MFITFDRNRDGEETSPVVSMEFFNRRDNDWLSRSVPWSRADLEPDNGRGINSTFRCNARAATRFRKAARAGGLLI